MNAEIPPSTYDTFPSFSASSFSSSARFYVTQQDHFLIHSIHESNLSLLLRISSFLQLDFLDLYYKKMDRSETNGHGLSSGSEPHDEERRRVFDQGKLLVNPLYPPCLS